MVDAVGGQIPLVFTAVAPPPPPAAPKDWCSPGFWLNNAVKFGARAWPVSAPVYSDYNSTAGRVAGCPSANGNPTLLQVLQNGRSSGVPIRAHARE
jgi:hypothetical protein